MSALTFFVVLWVALPARGETTVESVVAPLQQTWDGLKTYTCTLNAHEVLGTRVQDRVYHFWFRKPLDTRAEIIAGDGRGSLAVWRGGDHVKGHQGGFLSIFMLNVNIHSRLATTLRGATIADANIGAMIAQYRGFPYTSVSFSHDGPMTIVTMLANDPTKSGGITKEVYFFNLAQGSTGFEQYEGDTLVKRLTMSEIKVDPDIPDSMFEI